MISNKGDQIMKKISLFIVAFLINTSLFSGGPAIAPRGDDEGESCYEYQRDDETGDACNTPDSGDFEECNDPFEIQEFASAFTTYQGTTNTQQYPPQKKNYHLWTTKRSLQTEEELKYQVRPWHALFPRSTETKIDTFLNICFNGYENKKFLNFYNKFQSTPWLFDQLINHTYPSPFFWAVINGNVFMTSILLPHVSLENPFNKSTLFYAVLLQRKKIVKLLLNHGIDPDTPATRYHPHLDIVLKANTMKRFLKYAPKATWKTYAPLKAAILNNDLVMIKLLLKHGAQDHDSVQSTKIPHKIKQNILKLLQEKKLF